MTTSSILKRLDALDQRQLDAEPPEKAFIVMGEHDEQPANGEPYRKTGESEAACLARYGIGPKQPAIFIRIIDASVPRPNDH